MDKNKLWHEREKHRKNISAEELKKFSIVDAIINDLRKDAILLIKEINRKSCSFSG